MFGYKEDGDSENSSRATVPCWEGKSSGKKTECTLYTGLGGKGFEEICDPLHIRPSV
jgi:hypothetical protein